MFSHDYGCSSVCQVDRAVLNYTLGNLTAGTSFKIHVQAQVVYDGEAKTSPLLNISYDTVPVPPLRKLDLKFWWNLNNNNLNNICGTFKRENFFSANNLIAQPNVE